MTKQKLIFQGAEAKIYLINSKAAHRNSEPRRSQSAKGAIQIISKQRTKKSYRLEIIDNQIRTSRTKREAKLLTKASSLNINVPKILSQGTHNLEIEYIKGDKLSDTLNTYNKPKQTSTLKKLGKQVSKLHQANIIHGDLTTSNVILADHQNSKSSTSQISPQKIFIIDFGLGYISAKVEDKAVDLHLIKQALLAKHFQNHKQLFLAFLKGYNDSGEVIKRLEIVEKRGRYKN